ncbi:MAG: hypothetical protein JSV23_06070 [Promethearchaeota archaeon]|nr:MAG: hypothetical protein JSV23_06070 [Candidatus Lokiarchaeota archaeon]
MTEVVNKFLENLEYQISLKENSYKTLKKIPVFSDQVKKFDKSVIDLTEKFEKIRLRDKYQIIITELDNLIKQSKSK